MGRAMAWLFLGLVGGVQGDGTCGAGKYYTGAGCIFCPAVRFPHFFAAYYTFFAVAGVLPIARPLFFRARPTSHFLPLQGSYCMVSDLNGYKNLCPAVRSTLLAYYYARIRCALTAAAPLPPPQGNYCPGYGNSAGTPCAEVRSPLPLPLFAARPSFLAPA